uniref:Secreted protein n=2 Tax=Cacopsylla melanoneura TaxID=428564 RepID=A0A8D9F2C4_9HEMI
MVLSSNTVCAIFVAKFVLVIVLVSETLASNYPESNNPKPCAQKKNVITKTIPICVPQGKNGWTTESLDNCVKVLKHECPEFNEAECVWYTWKPAGCQQMVLPTCRLKYYAKKYTWMEIYYVNQYGTWADSKRAVFDIIEIHRLVKNHDAFRHSDQNDYPDNVLDREGERGLSWITQDNPHIKIATTEPICYKSDEGQDLCNVFIKNFLESQYPTGFVNSQVPGITPKEVKHKAKIVWNYSSECSEALIDKVKTDVCKVLFKRVSNYPVDGTCHIVLEAQAYSEKNHSSEFNHINPKDSAMTLRYAYFNYETEED